MKKTQPTGPRVTAVIQLDKLPMRCEFDCTEWFEQATAKELEELKACGFANDYAADAVARWYEDAISGIKDILDVDATLATSPAAYEDACGFTVTVNEAQAQAWIAANPMKDAEPEAQTIVVAGHRISYEGALSEQREPWLDALMGHCKDRPPMVVLVDFEDLDAQEERLYRALVQKIAQRVGVAKQFEQPGNDVFFGPICCAVRDFTPDKE